MNSELLIPWKYMIMSREVLSYALDIYVLHVTLFLAVQLRSRITCRRGTGTSTALHSCSKSVCLFQLWTRYSV